MLNSKRSSGKPVENWFSDLMFRPDSPKTGLEREKGGRAEPVEPIPALPRELLDGEEDSGSPQLLQLLSSDEALPFEYVDKGHLLAS